MAWKLVSSSLVFIKNFAQPVWENEFFKQADYIG